MALQAEASSLIPKVDIGDTQTDLAKKGSYLGQGIEDVYGQVFSQHSSELETESQLHLRLRFRLAMAGGSLYLLN